MNEVVKAEPKVETPPKPESGTKSDPYKGRSDAIAALTMTAYAKASTLQLTPEEILKLQEDFPDDAFRKGASGKDALIYIEHAFLRDRMNEVFAPGQWSIIPRTRWAVDFTTAKLTPGVKIYVEAMLVIRGCFVAEAVGDMDYWPNNDSTNYGDAVEGAKTSALRRCVKELGVGLQPWKKAWVEGWWKRNPTGRALPSTNPDDQLLEDSQIVVLNDLIAECQAISTIFNTEALWKWLEVEGMHQLPKSKFTKCVAELTRLRKKKK